MTKPVRQILGAMLVDSDFRDDMKATSTDAEIVAVVQSYQSYTLVGAELAVVSNMVDSFKDGKMEGPISTVRAECPSWPCN
jgi:hypothetical protein